MFFLSSCDHFHREIRVIGITTLFYVGWFLYVSCWMWGSWYHTGMPWLFTCHISLYLILINLSFFTLMWGLLDILGHWFWKYSYIWCSADYLSIYIIIISLTIFLVLCDINMFRVYVMPDDLKHPHILCDIYTKTKQSTWNTLVIPMTLNFFMKMIKRTWKNISIQ
jgi:hypothetical protein